MKKGFTLIELLAVIIILAIISLIATPIVLDVVNDAKDSAAKSEAAMIVSGVNNYCAASSMKEQLNGTTDICKDGVSKEEVSTMVDLGNAKVNSITYDKKVTSLEVESNERTVIYDGSAYTIAGNDSPVTPPTITYESYLAGDEVKLTDGTTWIVVKDTTKSESKIKLMATSNVKANITTEAGTDIFTPTQSEYALAYDDNSNVWANSTLKVYLDSTVKTRLETSLGTTISDITIWGAEELTALGCTVTGNDTDGYSKPTCDTTWYPKVFQNTYSWTKLPFAGVSSHAWIVFGSGSFGNSSVNSDGSSVGACPVITVSKDVITKKYYAFGLPTTESTTNYQDVITQSGSNAFVQLEGEQLSVCIYKNNKLECFKNNNYGEEVARLKNIFGVDNCNSYSTRVSCIGVDFSCSFTSDGYVACSDSASGSHCDVSAASRVNCY